MTATIVRMLATLLVFWLAGTFAQAEHLTLKSWAACPTIAKTNDMLLFDASSYSIDCEPTKSGSLMIVEREQQAPATRWICIDHPAPRNGTFTLCNWHTFQDELKT